MEANRILSSSMLDLVFDNRNKEYGAYNLRYTYPQRIKKALIVTGGITGLMIAGMFIGNSLRPKQESTVSVTQFELTRIDDQQKPPELPPPVKPKPVEQVRTVQFTPPVLTDNVETPPPSVDDINKAVIDVKPQDGVDDDHMLKPAESDAKGIIEAPKTKGDDMPLTFVQVPAQYEGDWQKFLLKNLRPDVPVSNGAAVGRYKVSIRFVVDTDGNVSGLEAISNNGYGMEEEAMRVLRKADKWRPGIQNGHAVKAYHIQTIVFEVLEE